MIITILLLPLGHISFSNVVIVRAAVLRCAHVGKWLNRLRAAWEGSSLNPPCCGRRRVAGGGLGRRQGVVEGGASFWWSGAASGRQRWAWQRRRWKGGRARAAGKHKGGGGKWLGASVGWALGGQGRRERTRGLSGPMHFGPKSETGMGARGRLRTTLSVWVASLGRVFCPHERVRTRSGRLRRPGGDALRHRAIPDTVWLFKSSFNTELKGKKLKMVHSCTQLKLHISHCSNNIIKGEETCKTIKKL
jgi:hypothetical protein